MRDAWRPLEGEAPLLAALLAAPTDPAAREAYADWLADRAPHRAEALRGAGVQPGLPASWLALIELDAPAQPSPSRSQPSRGQAVRRGA